MLAFSEILKSRIPKRNRKPKSFQHELIEKLLDIVLIIISVYIALFVESWAEHRHDKMRINQYYENMATEVQQDIADLKNEQKDAEIHISNCSKQLKLSLNKGTNDSIMKYFTSMFHSNLFASSQMLSYKSMVASGDLKLIEKLEVRNALSNLETAYLSIKISEDMYLDFLQKKMPAYLDEEFDLSVIKPIDPEFNTRIKFKNLVVQFLGLNQARLMAYKNGLEAARKVFKIVEKEIKNK